MAQSCQVRQLRLGVLKWVECLTQSAREIGVHCSLRHERIEKPRLMLASDPQSKMVAMKLMELLHVTLMKRELLHNRGTECFS